MLLAMARAMYKEWLDKDKLVLLKGWKRDGLTDAQIAHNMGISINTLNKWKREHVQIRQALKIGREEINYIVENALLKKALSGNTTAMIFFLKNNWRDKYNDSQLSKEERELVLTNIKKAKATARKTLAEAQLSEAQLKALEENDDPSNKTIIVDDIREIDSNGSSKTESRD